MSFKMGGYTQSGWRRHSFSFVVFLVISMAGCGSLEMSSHWRTQQIQIDGRNIEWQSVLTRIDDRQAMIGLINDNENLFVCLVTGDRGLQRQIIFSGLTLWFDHEGGEEKRFGIHFPLGAQGSIRTPGFISAQVPEQPEDDSLHSRFPVESSEVDIFGPMENEHHRTNVADLQDIALKIDLSGGTLIYELKVPLVDNGHDPYAIGARAGSVIGVGLETGSRAERRGSGGELGDGEGGGGMGRRGRGGRGGFGGGGERPPGFPQRSEPLSVWAKVQLATADSKTVH